MKKVFIIVFLFILVISYGQKDEYIEALEKNTLEVYSDFLAKYPDSKYESKILAKIVVLEQPAYLEAVSENTVEGLEKFLSDFPESKRKKSIQNKIEIVAFNQIQLSTDLKKLKNYLINYPESKYCETVVKKIEFVEVSKSNNIAELKAYLDSDPLEEYKREIEGRLVYYEKIPEIEVKEQIDDYYDLQIIIKAYLYADTKLSGKDILSKIEISRVSEIIWKTYTRLTIFINTIESNDSLLNAEIQNMQKAMIANWYNEVLIYSHFANKLLTIGEDVEVRNFSNTILASLEYGESFFKDYSKINELDSYKLLFETVYEDSKIEPNPSALSDDLELKSQFDDYKKNVIFYFEL